MKIKKYFKGNVRNAVLSPIFICLDTLGSICVPYFTAKIMDICIIHGNTNYILKMGLYMLILSLISMLTGFFAMYYS